MNIYIGLLISFGLMILAATSDGKACNHNGRTYNIGANFVDGNTVCKCDVTGNVLCYKGLGKCNAWGDPHYTSFDGRKFDFQGVCRYVLSRDCCGNSFTIEIEQKRYSPSTAVTDKFTIRFGTRVVHLDKVQVLIIDGLVVPTLFYDDGDLRCEAITGYMTVTLKKLGIWLRWNWQYHVQIFATPKYKSRLCGLCGDFNGDPTNDLSLTPTGEQVTVSEWGKSWRTIKQRAECIGTEPRVSSININDCRTKPADALRIAQCKTVLMSSTFSQCRSKISVKNFIGDCETEMCECFKAGRKDCICDAVSGYREACVAANIDIADSWKIKFGCGACVNGTSVYQHDQTYRNGCKVYKCQNGSLIPFKELGGCCKDRRQEYLHGQTWRSGSCTKTCDNSRIIVKSKNCCDFFIKCSRGFLPKGCKCVHYTKIRKELIS